MRVHYSSALASCEKLSSFLNRIATSEEWRWRLSLSEMKVYRIKNDSQLHHKWLHSLKCTKNMSRRWVQLHGENYYLHVLDPSYPVGVEFAPVPLQDVCGGSTLLRLHFLQHWGCMYNRLKYHPSSAEECPANQKGKQICIPVVRTRFTI
jgi:hypothetical protein